MKQKNENPEIYEYRTGGTELPHRSTLFAVGAALLIMVVSTFFAGTLGLLQTEPLDSRKSLAMLMQAEAPIHPDSTKPEDALYMDGDVILCENIGFSCQTISEFCKRIYTLPSGIYVVSVAQNTPAARLGVLPGDILLRIDGAPATLQQLLSNSPENRPMALEFYRKEKTYTVYFAPGD